MISTHFFKRVLLILLLALALHPSHVDAQQPTPARTDTLTLGEPSTGSLSGQGDTILYSLQIPPNRDVVISLEADAIVQDRYCMEISGQNSQSCQSEGGGGGDGPISITRLIPANQEGASLEIILSRPIEGAANYSLVAHDISPQELIVGETLEITPDETQSPYQVYTLDHGGVEPFTVTVEAQETDGVFLWSAYDPVMTDMIMVYPGSIFVVYPLPVDSSFSAEDENGLELLQILSFGGDAAYVLVKATNPYTLYAPRIEVPSLADGETLTLNLSYLTPTKIVRIEAEQGDTANINLSVTQGAGAQASVYAEDNRNISNLSLGAIDADTVFELNNTIEHRVESDTPLYLVVHIPFESTREPVTVEVSWQPAQ